MRPKLNFIHLDNNNIYEQLQLEEALLRADDRNWCIVQDGVDPSIVMGISGKTEESLNLNLMQQAPVPVIKRFSGGGTVFVDRNTVFVTFIFQSADLNISPCPDKVFCWSDSIYKALFDGLPYSLKERDYIFENRKFGGNAQYMRKDRWLHHSTLLWDYNEKNMDYLLLPKRRPKYRDDRPHKEFLCRLSDFLSAREELWEKLRNVLDNRFQITEVSSENLSAILQKPHRRSTTCV